MLAKVTYRAEVNVFKVPEIYHREPSQGLPGINSQ